MSNYKITFIGNNLYTRHEDEPAVFPRDAVEAKPATYENGKLVTPAVEPREAVAFKAAEYKYMPFRAVFDFENSDDLESGAELFKAWLEGEDSTDSLSDMLNISVEKEAKAYSVSYSWTKRLVTAEMAADYELDDKEEVESWLSENGDDDLYNPQDEGEISDIEVEEIANEYIYVEWN